MHRIGLNIVLLLLTLLCCTIQTVSAFNFDDLERLEGVEQEELLTKAKQAARNWSFGSARSYLEQAQNKGYAPAEIAEVEQLIAQNEAAKAEKERREEEERRRAEEARREEEARRAALAAAQADRDNSGNMGGALNCSYVAKDYALYDYCKSGRCGGLAGDYALWSLCEHDDISGMARNYGIWHYLKDGDASGLSGNYNAWIGAQKNAGSFADRKRFIIYYQRGYIYGHR